MSTDSNARRLREARAAQMDLDELSQRRMRARGRQQELRRQLDGDGAAPALAGDTLDHLEQTVESLEVAEEELRQQNEDLQSSRLAAELARQRYEDLFDLAPDGYLVTTASGTVREANRAALTLLASTRSFVTGKPATIFFADGARRDVRALLARLEREDRVDDVELELKPRAGEPFAVAVTIAVARNSVGRATGLRWLLRDARERAAGRARLASLAEQLEARVAERTVQLDAARRMQEELVRLERAARAQAERAQERLRYLASASTVLSDADGLETVVATAARLAVPALGDWCAVYALGEDGPRSASDARIEVAHAGGAVDGVADALRRRFVEGAGRPPAVTRALLAGKPELVADLASWSDAPSAADAAHLRLLYSLGMRSSITVPLAARGRRVGVLCCMASAHERRFDETDLRAAESLARVVAVAVDDARRIERAERVAAEAERRAAAAQHGVAAMMHDVRTPLVAVSGYADLLALGAYGPLTAAQGEAVARLHKGYEYMLELVDAVQTFTRLDGGEIELAAREVDVDTLLADLYPQIEHALGERGVEYERRRGDRPLAVVTDAAAVRRIVVNLLTNAIKFTPPGGCVTLSWEADERTLFVRVHDTGRGIAAEHLELVFEPFAQLAPAAGSERPGIGLGLAIARRLARALGGELVAESEPSVGSTFTLRIPLSQPDDGAARLRAG